VNRFDEKISGFLGRQRVAHFASADVAGQPHVVPVCYAFSTDSLYFSIDEKPKKTARNLKRLRNIQENPKVSIVIDRYDEDWQKLGWVMVSGRAEILHDGDEHGRAQAQLKDRYPQLRTMQITSLPVVATRVDRVTHWGQLAAID